LRSLWTCSATHARSTRSIAANNRLHAFRERYNLTQQAAAALLNIPLRTYENWEGSINKPTPRGAVEIALREAEKTLTRKKRKAL
jgi:DNA-binding transcriptional regulator YiaG